MTQIYRTLGVEPIINAAGTVTAYSGSLMPPEVSDAMNQASRAFVIMEELHLAAGRAIAEMIGVPAAHVCCSATAGVALMAAACITGCDRDLTRRLPDVDGLKHEFIVQRTHRMAYDQAVRLSGGRFVEIDPDPQALEAAFTPQTAGVFYVFSWGLTGPAIPLPVVAEIAHARGVPVIVDAASELPPMENLRRFYEEGGDLVVFSGGKGFRGPQASGLVLGKPELVEACRLNDCPNPAIGRSMKTGKEEIVGLVKAVELYVQRDHAAEQLVWDRRVQYLIDQVSGIPTVEAWRQLPYGVGQFFPHMAMTWDVNRLEVSYQEFWEAMLAGPPRIMTQQYDDPFRDRQRQIRVHVHGLHEGQEVLIAQRMRTVLGT
ncbi:MAG: L-seryl-tRNA selenium transferase [Chloroflexi bacterium]|nr:MAG: L-seryl-tRNA selenium transferase [Chloroflexota bacterium]